jgi:hypothetical protein
MFGFPRKSRVRRVAVACVLAVGMLALATTALAGRGSGRANVPPPTGGQPGAAWQQLAPSSLVANPTFSYVQGSPVAGGCRYQGSLDMARGAAPTVEVGVWVDPSTCTLELATGQPTSELVAILPADATVGQPIGDGRQVPLSPLSTAARTPSLHRRASYTYSHNNSVAAYDNTQWQVYANFSMQWNADLTGTASDTAHNNPAGGWGSAYYTEGGGYSTTHSCQPGWGSTCAVTSGAAEWHTNNYNAEGACHTSGLTDVYIAGALYGSTGGSTHLDWAVTPTGACASYLFPVIF